MTTRSNTPRLDIYQSVTDTIVRQMEDNPGGWIVPWVQAGVPVNATTEAQYRGTNHVLLSIQSLRFGSNIWASYKQWQGIDAQVRKGERGSLVIFFSTLDRENEAGEACKVPFLKRSTVFNASQVDGFELPETDKPCLATRIAGADAFVSNTGADVRHNETRAFYNRSGDFVNVPNADLFHDTEHSSATEGYYSTLCHELTHWTGAPHRLARTKGKAFGDTDYAFEELVAELGAAFACAHLGIASEPRKDHAQYLAGWLEALKNDKRVIIRAASLAQKAFDYMDALQKPVQMAA